jgi:pimeloyl-ACP methyl ester carboxylesterase
MSFLSAEVGEHLWPRVISWRENPSPNDPAWVDIRCQSRDGAAIFGRCLNAGGNAPGTMLYAHGFCSNGGAHQGLAYRLREQFACHVILPDLRHHGLSENRPPSFGTAEAWDLAACLDWAEQNDLPKPFSVIGGSMGGMAVQRLVVEDARVSNAVCIHTPGWPWDAIGKVISWNVDGCLGNLPLPVRTAIQPLEMGTAGLGNMINEAYGFDILRDGDPRCHTPNPPGEPRILYFIGEDDPYEPDKSRQVWQHFYPHEDACEGVWPGDAPHQRKFFLTIPGFRHNPPGPTVFEWDGFWPLLHSFFGHRE